MRWQLECGASGGHGLHVVMPALNPEQEHVRAVHVLQVQTPIIVLMAAVSDYLIILRAFRMFYNKPSNLADYKYRTTFTVGLLNCLLEQKTLLFAVFRPQPGTFEGVLSFEARHI